MASGSLAPVTPEVAQARQITVLSCTALSPEALRALTQAALTEAAAGHIRPVIGQELDLTQAAAAHAAIEARATIGKTLLTVPRVRPGPGAITACDPPLSSPAWPA